MTHTSCYRYTYFRAKAATRQDKLYSFSAMLSPQIKHRKPNKGAVKNYLSLKISLIKS
jgi:hypothetical protein